MNDQNKNRKGHWLADESVWSGVIACILAGSMLTVAFAFFFSLLADEQSIETFVCVTIIWLIAIGAGMWQITLHRSKKRQQRR
jgi:ABC-type uncharacterized transport system permease subunit